MKEDNIECVKWIKINNYKIVCGKIYCILHKTYISIESYIAINGDINSIFNIILNNGRCKKTNLINTNNNMTNNNLIVYDDNITLTSGLLHLLRISGETDIVENILINNNDVKWNNYNIVA